MASSHVFCRPLPAAEKAGEAFLWRLFRECQDHEIQKVGVPPFPESLVRFQWTAREQMLREQYPDADRFLVAANDESEYIGALIVNRPADGAIRLVDLCLLPAFRGRGIGTALLVDLQNEARAHGKSLDLSVAADNAGARRLYNRLGFGPADPMGEGTVASTVYLHLTWPAAAEAAEKWVP